MMVKLKFHQSYGGGFNILLLNWKESASNDGIILKYGKQGGARAELISIFRNSLETHFNVKIQAIWKNPKMKRREHSLQKSRPYCTKHVLCNNSLLHKTVLCNYSLLHKTSFVQ